MITAPIPDNEAERLASIKKMQILHTPEEEAFDRIARLTQKIFNVPVVFISIVGEDFNWIKSKVGIDETNGPRDVSICSHIVFDGEIIVVEDASKDERFFDNDLVCNQMNIRFYAGRPLRNTEGFIVGTLCIVDHQPRTFSDDDIDTLNALGHWVESVFEARGLSKSMGNLLVELDDVRRNSMLDSLLRIWNRGAIEDILKREADLAQRQKSMLSILMVDIDLFKKINDEHGHPVGDAALLSVVKVLRQQLRSYDSLGRYGGEEFLVILPNTSQNDAYRLADRLRETVAKNTIKLGDTVINCTVSIGMANTDFSKGIININQRLIAADNALLSAKTNGRNRVEIAVD
ncbi:hypothetical protein A7981_06335 [Methylovorus sp. MM2]|uniref:sensor domain-containing diguanylate cyclase n=1 Tax=Methylovorus sp. MM2 TaxID=1848038 RepID=UPI0007E1B2ED|nr:sensor domain-containing diguanylate cyclase [Methylovorus sp. MM2]OAM53036.1 hypothetical protein A7981_06335 [Methylovorus sp. MM2]